jgi:hypothetical protein
MADDQNQSPLVAQAGGGSGSAKARKPRAPRKAKEPTIEELAQEFIDAEMERQSAIRATSWVGYVKNLLNYYKGQIIIFCVFVMWTALSYEAPHLYVNFCAPRTFLGFFMSPFYGTAIHCAGLRWLISTGNTQIESILIAFGMTIGTFLTRFNIFFVPTSTQRDNEEDEEEE